MYNHIKIDNPPLEDLRQVGLDLVLEIIEMLPNEFEKAITEMTFALEDNDYKVIERGAHSIKSNLKIFMDEDSPAAAFSFDLEKRAHKVVEEIKEFGAPNQPVDFSLDIQKLIDLTNLPMQEIIKYGEELKNS